MRTLFMFMSPSSQLTEVSLIKKSPLRVVRTSVIQVPKQPANRAAASRAHADRRQVHGNVALYVCSRAFVHA